MNTQTNTKSLDNLANAIREQLKELAGNEDNQDVRSRVMDNICQLVSAACKQTAKFSTRTANPVFASADMFMPKPHTVKPMTMDQAGPYTDKRTA